ncbi:molybdopterin molybdotransferase MoeA [Methanoplanus sp. FWC-SCC4]|uniref:Molybdopterin molybdotransferase MoeA n=1 Tax=Methanochimaera problematica TaxID=2609417 RepID=A0AA97FD71_9EURY|nr:gephyrin-like molybdotransferase Glp [Methanoplanus sp. FWC-SCC4]WOF15306.1 molybdopterin molybdotransferase MoeA [Methanoplanus sp. FWC-SCC4]
MSFFLKLISVSEAKAKIREIAGETYPQKVTLSEAYDRVLASDVLSDADVPGFSRSIVDGYAVVSKDTTGAGESIPTMLEYLGRVEMGTPAQIKLTPGTCAYVPTGGNVPDGADAVAMVEYSEALGDEVLIFRPMSNGENIVFADEDFAKGSPVMKKGTTLKPQECGVLASLGKEEVEVFKKPVIGIISTGNELVPVSKEPGFGKVRDVNTYLCSGFVKRCGCIPKIYGVIPDERDELREAIRLATEECDAVLISGGSSKDERDNTSSIIKELGEVLIHGIAISPGKPTIIGTATGKPVIGLPGHPASAYIVLYVLVSELLYKMQMKAVTNNTITTTLLENIPSAQGREDYVRVKLSDDGAKPLYAKSGLLNTLIKSDGMVKIPSGSEGLEAGSLVEVILW